MVTGWCTRLVPWLSGLDKKYVATLRLGEETDTLDPEGELIGTAGVPSIEALERAVAEFRGPIQQIPPEYSAVHTSGERAYKLARAGQHVELKPRNVEIYQLDIMDFEPPDLTVHVHCSKGTYIRSLARDIGKAAGSRAHVTDLRRTQVGPFCVDESRRPEEIVPERDTISAAAALASLDGLQVISVPDEVAHRTRHGMKMYPRDLGVTDGEVVVTDMSGRLLAIVEKSGNAVQYRLVVPG